MTDIGDIEVIRDIFDDFRRGRHTVREAAEELANVLRRRETPLNIQVPSYAVPIFEELRRLPESPPTPPTA